MAAPTGLIYSSDLQALRCVRGSAGSGDFIRALEALLGQEHVRADAATRQHWARTTLPEGTTPRAVVWPGCAEEVRAVLRIAYEHRIAVYPISSGRNWGYGDACAPGDGQVLLDLSRMNRIVEVNADLAYATVEPGVTQGQLTAFLERQGMALMADATGAGPDTSLIGNTLERGFGHTPHGDRFAHVCGLEAVLPDGRLLRTGFGHLGGARSAAVYRWGVGPYLDGLFTQSNFGVVTRMTVWLQPKPEALRAFFFSLSDDARLWDLLEALRRLRLRGTLRSPVHTANDLRMISMSERYPWDAMRGDTPLCEALRSELRNNHGIGAWCGSGGLYGSEAEVAAAAGEVRKALRRVPGLRLVFLDERRLRWARAGAKCLGKLGLGQSLCRALEKMELGFDLLRGKPTRLCLNGGMWRSRRAVPAEGSDDPRDLGAGFLWLSPVIPCTREDLARLHAAVLPIFRTHGFDYLSTLSMVSERALSAVMTICFDKDDAADTERARCCQAELLETLLAAGYPPYRAHAGTMRRIAQLSETYFDVARELKAALDPRGILAPGRW